MPRPPPPLPDELVEEVLLRFPPENPAWLVRAGLVCTCWCRLVSDPSFRRRFCEFHRSPPMLGVLYDLDNTLVATTMPFCSPHAGRRDWRVLDAHNGRVLCEKGSGLAVWDPITDEVRELPFPQEMGFPWTAAVVCCSAAGACSYLDCHPESFLIVLVSMSTNENHSALVHTYSSDAADWSEQVVCTDQNFKVKFFGVNALAGNSIYLGNAKGSTALKYDLELCQVSVILLPHLHWRISWEFLLTTREDGGLGLIYKDDSKIYVCSRKDTPELGVYWERRFIRLKKVFPVGVDVAELCVIGYGVGIIFVRMGGEVYTINKKTPEVKKVFQGTSLRVIPYMSFYTPALKGTCTGEGPSAGHSSA